MRGTWTAALVLAVCPLLAGCALPDATPPSRGGGRDVAFEVTAADLVPGRCFDGAQSFGDVCHRLDVRVDNEAYRNDLEAGGLHWEAEDDQGRVHDFAETDADRVAAGRTVEIRVAFTLDDGPQRLVELRYAGFQGKAPVPAY